jgi:Protein of unknown function (DUF1569)
MHRDPTCALVCSISVDHQEPAMAVDTAKVQGRRPVAYTSFGEMLADAERVTSGKFKTLGNWTAGQIFAHLAKSFDTSIDGSDAQFPWYIRTLARVFKKQMLKRPMPAGFKLPAEAAAALVPPATSTAEGLAALRSAVARLENEPKRAYSPVLGEMTRDQWNQLHLSHANLHMSFVVPDDGNPA